MPSDWQLKLNQEPWFERNPLFFFKRGQTKSLNISLPIHLLPLLGAIQIYIQNFRLHLISDNRLSVLMFYPHKLQADTRSFSGSSFILKHFVLLICHFFFLHPCWPQITDGISSWGTITTIKASIKQAGSDPEWLPFSLALMEAEKTKHLTGSTSHGARGSPVVGPVSVLSIRTDTCVKCYSTLS